MAEYLWISRIINDIESKRPCFIIKTDNQSTMKIFKDGPQRHFKHIDIRREYVLYNLNRNECKIVYIPGENSLVKPKDIEIALMTSEDLISK